MSFETYDVYFSGALLKDADPAAVRSRIGRLFKLEGPRLERLFSGRPIAIKKDLDMEQAARYRVAFREAGALVEIRPAGQAPSPASAGAATEDARAAYEFSVSAPRGYDLRDCAPRITAQPLPDITDLDLDKPGARLDTRPPPAPLEIDTAVWALDPPGAVLDGAAPPESVKIDTSELSLEPPRQGSLADDQQTVTPAPLPAIDHLELDAPEEAPRGKASFRLSED